MEPYVRNFLRSALIWLAVGVLLGFSFVFWPSHVIYRPAHVHANLLGFVSMMIFGVAYHVVPRFTGNPLHARRLPVLHLILANTGLALMVGGFVARPHWAASGYWLLGTGTILTTAGVGLFIYNIWRTLGPVRRELRTTAPMHSLRQEAR